MKLKNVLHRAMMDRGENVDATDAETGVRRIARGGRVVPEDHVAQDDMPPRTAVQRRANNQRRALVFTDMDGLRHICRLKRVCQYLMSSKPRAFWKSTACRVPIPNTTFGCLLRRRSFMKAKRPPVRHKLK